jgi:two-component system, sensor histidine kinase LadS
MRWARLLVCLWWGLVAFGAYANSDDLIVSRAVFVEPAPGSLSIQEAIKQDYKPFANVMNRSFSPTIRWVRILVKAPAEGEQQIVLRVGPHYIAQIELFQEKNGVWAKRVAGDHYPVDQNSCVDNLYCFPITTKAGVENYFYLRIQTTNGFFLYTRALEPDTLAQEVMTQQRTFGLESGIVIAIAIWALLVFFRTRSKLAGIFFFSQVMTLLFSMSSSGLLAELYFKGHVWLDNLTFNTLYVFRLMASLLLTHELLKSYEPPRWFGYYVKISISILLLELLALKLGHVLLISLNFNFLLFTIIPIAMLAALPGCRNMPPTHRKLILFGTLIVGSLLWIDILPVMGWVRPDLVAAPGNWSGLIVAVILSIMVVSDITHRRVIYEREMQQLQFMRARNLVETEQIKERSMLIDMLTHELKNPLATMRMAAGSLRRSLSKLTDSQVAESTDRIDSMVQAINNMNTVIERCVQVDQLDQKGINPSFEDVDVNEVLETILSRSGEASRVDLSVQSELKLRTDPNLLAIIISNLLDNAMKYSQPDSRIAIVAFGKQDANDSAAALTLQVSNAVTAVEIPDPESIFNRYYRGPYAHEKSGTGLGLYLVQSLCKILRGTVRFEQKDSQVIFTVELKE